MAFKIFQDGHDNLVDVVVVDNEERILTSVSRTDELVETGHLFEACATLAAIVDGLLLMYVMMARQVNGIAFEDRFTARLAAERTTMGEVHDALRDANAYHDAQIQADADRFIELRNHLVHRTAATIVTPDMTEMRALGRDVALRLWRRLHDATAAHRAANP